MMMKTRVAVVGAGKFGAYHAAKYAAMDEVELIAIIDNNLNAAESLATKFGCSAVDSLEAVLTVVDAVSITTPASTHADLSIKSCQAGLHVYIEKPIATTLQDADRILAAAGKADVVVSCGFQERYILSRLSLNGDRPRRIECRRLGKPNGRGLDVDVALDLMIHDVDLVLQLTGNDILAVESNATSHRHLDDLSAVIRTSACTAYLHASRKSTYYERTMLLVYETGVVHVDFLTGRVHDSRPASAQRSMSLLEASHDPLSIALSDFISSVRSGTTPYVSGESARATLAMTLQLRYESTSRSAQAPGIPLFRMADHQDDPCMESRVRKVLEHQRYIDGPEVHELEEKLAKYADSKYCLAVASGTAALTIALMAEDLCKDDAVFIPALTYNATANAVICAGATPVFVDVDRHTCNVSAETLLEALEIVLSEKRLRPAIVCAVDLYGKPAPYDDLRRIAQQYSMSVLADAAQSFGGMQAGRKVGSLADMTATSFYPSKTLGGYGDGGALFTNDARRFEIWKSIRWHGTDVSKRESIRLGLNGRLSTLQCALLLPKLETFEVEMSMRQEIAFRYRQKLSHMVTLQQCGQDERHANGLLTIVLADHEERERVQMALKAHSIGCGAYYTLPLHRHKAFQQYVLLGQDFEHATFLADRVLSLPMSPFMQQHEVDKVCDVLIEALGAGVQPSRMLSRL